MLRLTATFTCYTVCYYPFLTRNHLRTDNADGYRALAFPRPNFLSLYILTNNGVQLHSSQQLRLTAEQLVELEHGGRESLLILFLHFSFLFLFFFPLYLSLVFQVFSLFFGMKDFSPEVESLFPWVGKVVYTVCVLQIASNRVEKKKREKLFSGKSENLKNVGANKIYWVSTIGGDSV